METNQVKNLKQGDIFTCRWGYEQTNADFYRVLNVGKSTVEIVKVESVESVDGPRAMTGTAVPDPDTAVGVPMRRKVKNNGCSECFLQMNSYSFAYPWDGKPVRVSSYA